MICPKSGQPLVGLGEVPGLEEPAEVGQNQPDPRG